MICKSQAMQQGGPWQISGGRPKGSVESMIHVEQLNGKQALLRAAWNPEKYINTDAHTAMSHIYSDKSTGNTFELIDLDASGVNDVIVTDDKVRKVLENGQIFIISGDAKYNVMGSKVN